MKKRFTAILACILAAGALISCGKQISDSEFGSLMLNAFINSEPINSDAEMTLKRYILSTCGRDKMQAISYLYPQSILKAIKDTDIADNYSVVNMEWPGLTEFRIAEYRRVYADFGKAGFEAASEYFSRIASDNGIEVDPPLIVNGYNVVVEFTVKAGDEEFSDKLIATVVVVMGEGWKVIPMSIDDLMEAVQE